MIWYGTRDAGKNFEQKVAKISEACGCVRGIFCPVVYVHSERNLVFFHHGDDFILMGSEESIAWYRVQTAFRISL